MLSDSIRVCDGAAVAAADFLVRFDMVAGLFLDMVLDMVLGMVVGIVLDMIVGFVVGFFVGSYGQSS
jgi:hypothetical protein